MSYRTAARAWLPARERPGGAEELEERAPAEQVEVERAGVVRVGVGVPRGPGAREAAIQPRAGTKPQ